MKLILSAVLAVIPALAAAHCGSCGMGDEKHETRAPAKHDHSAAMKGHDHKAAAGAAATMTGEVVDLSCFMAHEGRGDKHMKCAKACLEGGKPAGLLGADGTVTLLLEDHGQAKAYKLLAELAGQQAEVSGKKVAKGGVAGLVVSAVKKAKKS